MRRAPALVVVVGVVAAWLGSAGQAHADGFWVSLAAGAAGAAEPSDYSEFWFDSPHAPPIAVTGYNGGGTVHVGTGGGNTFFGGAGVPVLLPTTDGYATLTNLEVANGSGGLPRFAGATQASGAPIAGSALGSGFPAGTHQANVGLADPDATGGRVLSIGITDENGNPVGSGQVVVPNGGWWVIGLGPGAGEDKPVPDPIGGGGGDGEGQDDGGSPIPVPVPGSTPGPVNPPPINTTTGGGSIATPEPATLVLFGLGGLTAVSWRMRQGK